jgi:hypothetical protein
LIPYAGSEQTRTAPSPPPGRCRSHAQQSAPLISLLPMTARSAHLRRTAATQMPVTKVRFEQEEQEWGIAGYGSGRRCAEVRRALDGAAVDTVRRSS